MLNYHWHRLPQPCMIQCTADHDVHASLPRSVLCTAVRSTGNIVTFTARAVASLTVPGGQEFHFPHFSSNFDQFILGTGAKFGHTFGLTTCGRPQLKLYLLLLFYDLGLRPFSGAGRRKLQPNLAPTPYFSSNFTHFLPHFGSPGGRLAHPGRPWLRHCSLPTKATGTYIKPERMICWRNCIKFQTICLTKSKVMI